MMASWIEPIYDRTYADVDYAKARIKYYKANGGITDGEILKGVFSANDMNRIENNARFSC